MSDVACPQVISKTEQETYREQVVAWEREQERQIVEFTITEDDINADQRAASPMVWCFKVLLASLC